MLADAHISNWTWATCGYLKQKIVLIKCLKRHYSTVQSMKSVAVLTEDGAFALFFSSPPRGIWQLRSPHPREFAIREKKRLMPGGQPRGGGWAQLELTDT